LKRGYEANWGQCKQCRAIVFHSNQQRRAQEVWDMARAKTTVEYFGDLAEEYSVEASSRVLRGEIPPVPKHGAQPVLEREAFALHPGELSGVFQLADKWVILLCEGDLNRNEKAPSFEEVRAEIYDDIYEKKLRVEMAREFLAIQDHAQVDNFLTGTLQSPTKGKNIETISAPGMSAGARTPAQQPTTLRK
jgi:parvulin-like peptidyl-prolyl isomerase